MKVETPQILWNSEEEKGINAALNSISMLESGLSDENGTSNAAAAERKYDNVLVTAGNGNVINLWKLCFASSSSSSRNNENTASATSSANSSSSDPFSKRGTKIEYLCSLTRQELSVNTVAFSPDGLHLATGGESGSIVIWSVPPNRRGNGNGRHHWSLIGNENELSISIIGGHRGGICDISWSADSKRFIAGTIDHSVSVYEDKNYDANQKAMSENKVPEKSQWHLEHQNSMDHTLFVQGVAYDPLGVYLASMGSDRTVRVFPRKTPSKAKKKILRPSNAVAADCCPPVEHQRLVEQILTDSKLELGKSKQIKFRQLTQNSNNNDTEHQDKKQRRHLYADEATHNSSFRRLAWTTDGAYLVTPAAFWHADEVKSDPNDKNLPSYATYLFARHRFDEPYKVLYGLEKPSVVVRPSPVLYKLPTSGVATESPLKADCKENEAPLSRSRGLPYRSVFAVLTIDSILVYDTHHTRPLSAVRGLHYASFSDCHWSNDGTKLVVSSLDGYVSIVSFEKGEFGEVYTPVGALEAAPLSTSPATTANPLQAQSSNIKPSVLLQQQSKWKQSSLETPSIPPCEPGQSATLEAPPSKRAKKTRIAPTLITRIEATTGNTTTGNTTTTTNFGAPSTEDAGKGLETAPSSHTKRSADEILEHETHTKLTLSNSEKPKKKKRIQPLLVSAANM
ncbi:Chromatin assembly factor 1 subunit FAS2 homolog [Seminavis robusta]|uniref:Chromatin assembly factor 1 subunit FAS2 homolog n=1 Tax=Seminavis robusta TaxID=568900 RepID=A0A9N8E9Y7_9STRA|nr:Chromatin assembly factor 1 subunit FAS2 homolog [Seminavis robusta]|eukprot:Sro841_g209590.1 Chromatin assembly factor 1 subunit FAS2 homolog (681) ;mRNA; r:31270-33384